MPAWFTKADSAFFRKYITKEVWANILSNTDHEVLKEECETHGIPFDTVQFYWHKSKRISLFAKTGSQGLPIQAIFENLAQRFGEYKLPSIKKTKDLDSGFCAILNLYDAHLDKISVAAETGKSSTIENNIERYISAFDRLLSKVLQHAPELIVLPIGNDFFHANDFTGRTKKGTNIQYLASPEEAYPLVCDVAVSNLHKLAQTGAKIVVPFVKGNHDEDNVTILGFWLRKLFADFENVHFMPGRMQRNYLRYGKNLFGFAHGDKEKSKINDLPLLMAEEASKEWAATKYRKFFCGDLHHQFEHRFLKVKDKPGVQVSFLRSIGADDKFHVDHGWIGIPKTAYAEVWHKKEGKAAGYEVNF